MHNTRVCIALTRIMCSYNNCCSLRLPCHSVNIQILQGCRAYTSPNYQLCAILVITLEHVVHECVYALLQLCPPTAQYSLLLRCFGEHQRYHMWRLWTMCKCKISSTCSKLCSHTHTQTHTQTHTHTHIHTHAWADTNTFVETHTERDFGIHVIIIRFTSVVCASLSG